MLLHVAFTKRCNTQQNTKNSLFGRGFRLKNVQQSHLFRPTICFAHIGRNLYYALRNLFLFQRVNRHMEDLFKTARNRVRMELRMPREG
jgi:hypothetical protein